jgi:hypothetical protein
MKQRNETPTDVFNAFLVTRLSGDIEAVKGRLAESTLNAVEEISVNQEKSFDEALNIVGRFYGQHHSERLPFVRNEKIDIDGDIACVEVENFSSGNFDNFVLLKENGVWKLALDVEVAQILEVKKNAVETAFDYLQITFKTLFGKDKAKS